MRVLACSRFRTATIAAVAGACGACGRASAPPPCPAPAVAQAGWREMSEGPFRFRLPPGFRPAPPRIADSWIRRYVDAEGSSLLQVQYGPFPVDTLLDGGGRCTDTIGGRAVALATGTAGRTQTGSRYVALAVWNDVQPGNSLAAWAEAPDPERLRVLLSAMRTVRFAFPTAPEVTTRGP